MIVARTDALAANLLTSDIDERDAQFVTGERTAEGFYRVGTGWRRSSPAAWPTPRTRTSSGWRPVRPTWQQAREFAEAIHAEHPDQMLAYNCSPSFNWKAALDDDQIAKFQRELAAMGSGSSSSPWPGSTPSTTRCSTWPAVTPSRYDGLRRPPGAGVRRPGAGFTAVKHQREVGTGYFDQVSTALNPASSTTALRGSTEEEQFH